ncbi:MAG TPA: calcium-binding protein [Rhizomicrobium sp.]|jgi:Ca2+-binding RTX toxin-like protein
MGTFLDETKGLGIGNAIGIDLVSDIENNGVWSGGGTEVDFGFKDQGGHSDTLKVFGTGLTRSGSSLSGTVTGVDLTVGGVHVYALSGVSMSASLFKLDLDDYNASALTEALYAGNDKFDMRYASASGPADSLYGGAGNDTFVFKSNFDPDDRIDGGTGNDVVGIDGAYSGVVIVGQNTLTNVEDVKFQKGHSYHFDFDADQSMKIDASALLATDSFHGGTAYTYTSGALEVLGGAGSDELFGALGNDKLYGNAGDDVLNGGANNDVLDGGDGNDTLVGWDNDRLTGDAGDDIIDLRAFGNFKASGGDGNDTFLVEDQGGSFSIDGGAGNDTIKFNGFVTGWNLGSAVKNVEKIVIDQHQGANFTLDIGAATAAAGQTLTVDGRSAIAVLTIDGSAEKSGALIIEGGSNNDTLVGGHGNDILYGGAGSDHLTGGAGDDVFKFASAADSPTGSLDIVTGFDARHDKFDLPGSVKVINSAVTVGDLSNISSVIGDHQLSKAGAVVFTPSTGTYKGDSFLIVDMNGQAGYQSGKDLVLFLDDAAHLSSLATGNFI